MASPPEFQPYRKVQGDAEQELRRILESTAKAIEKRVAKLSPSKIGGVVRAAQLRAVLGQIRRLQRAMWVGAIDPMIAGMIDEAIKAGDSAVEALTRVAYASLNRDAAEALVRGLEASAQAGLKADAARRKRELSARVYKQASLDSGKVEQIIRQGIISNLSAKELARDVYDHVSPTTRGGSAYAAQRLARTEINNAFHERQIEGAKRPGVEAVKWNLSGSHTTPDECNLYAAHEPYAPDKIPEKPHPNCFCYLTYVTMSSADFRKALEAGDFDDELARRTRENMALLGQPVGDIKPPTDENGMTAAQFSSRVNKAATSNDALTAATYGLERKLGSKNYNRMEREMRKGINQYVGRWYTEINALLRGKPLQQERDRETVQEYIDGIDQAMENSTIDKDVLVYRGIREAEKLFGDRLDHDMTGTEWVEEAYVSTTAVQARTRTFTSGSSSGKVLMTILVPKGTPAVEASPIGAEAELLLGRGRRLRVVSDNGLDDSGKRLLDVVVIND